MDSSCLGNPRKGGLGGVFRDHSGNWVSCFNNIFVRDTNTLMEIIALKEGLKPALHNLFKPLEINIDSNEVIRMLNEGNSHYDVILDECRWMLREVGGEVMHHYYREKNGVADLLVKQTATTENSGRLQIFVVPLMYALDQVLADINGTKYNRLVNASSTQPRNSPTFLWLNQTNSTAL